MASKTISVKESVYALLARHKRPGESFSELFQHTFSGRRKLSDFKGAWANLPESDIKQMKDDVRTGRSGYGRDFDLGDDGEGQG